MEPLPDSLPPPAPPAAPPGPALPPPPPALALPLRRTCVLPGRAAEVKRARDGNLAGRKKHDGLHAGPRMVTPSGTTMEAK